MFIYKGTYKIPSVLFTMVILSISYDIITMVNKTEQIPNEPDDRREMTNKRKAQICISMLNSYSNFSLIKITGIQHFQVIAKLKIEKFGARWKERGRSSLSGDASERSSCFEARRRGRTQ